MKLRHAAAAANIVSPGPVWGGAEHVLYSELGLAANVPLAAPKMIWATWQSTKPFAREVLSEVATPQAGKTVQNVVQA